VIVSVVGLRGSEVRLGITAPASTTVHRAKVYESIKRREREADALAAFPASAS
jgi:carbon storage regulator CsrA